MTISFLFTVALVFKWPTVTYTNQKKWLQKNGNVTKEMDNLIFIESLGLDIRKEIAVILIRSWSCLNYFKGYHAYQNIWIPEIGEIILEKLNQWIHLINRRTSCRKFKGTTRKFANTVFYFLKSDDNNKCGIEVTVKRHNLGDGGGMQVLYLLNFERRKAYW